MAKKKEMRELCKLWNDLSDIPVDRRHNNSLIDEDFLHFEKGTHVFDVWDWFEDQNPDFLVGKAGSRIVGNHPFLLKENVNSIKNLTADNKIEEAVALFELIVSNQMSEDDFSITVSAFIEDSKVISGFINNGFKKSLVLNFNLTIILQELRNASEDSFKDAVNNSNKHTLRKIIESNFRYALSNKMSMEAFADMVGYEFLANQFAINISESLDDNFNNLMQSYWDHLDKVSKSFPVIEYIMDKYDNIAARWSSNLKELSDFVHNLSLNYEEYDSDSVIDFILKKATGNVRSGLHIDSLMQSETRLTSSNKVGRDLFGALHLIEKLEVKEGYSGYLTTQAFVSFIKESNDIFSKKDIKNLEVRSHEVERVISELPREVAERIINIDPYNADFSKIKWKDKSILRTVMSNNLGL